MYSKLVFVLVITGLLIFAAACSSRGGGATKEIRSGKVGNLTVTLANSDGVLRQGEQELTLAFKDAAGTPVDVGAAALSFHMPAMGAMAAMNDAAALTTTGTPGVYHAKVKLQMGGEWQAQVTYEGPAGKAQGSFPITAQ